METIDRWLHDGYEKSTIFKFINLCNKRVPTAAELLDDEAAVLSSIPCAGAAADGSHPNDAMHLWPLTPDGGAGVIHTIQRTCRILLENNSLWEKTWRWEAAPVHHNMSMIVNAVNWISIKIKWIDPVLTRSEDKKAQNSKSQTHHTWKVQERMSTDLRRLMPWERSAIGPTGLYTP